MDSWSIYRIGTLCKLHLLNKRFKPGDEIVGILDFTDTEVVCAKYTCILQSHSFERSETKSDISIGFKQHDFVVTIPELDETLTPRSTNIVDATLSLLFYITDRDFSKALMEDRAGIIEMGPNTLDVKLFSCDFPITIYT